MLITLAFISCHKIDLPKPENQFFSTTQAEQWWNTVFVVSDDFNALDENSLYAQPSRSLFARKAGKKVDSTSNIGSIKNLNWKNATSYKVSNLEAVEVPMVYDGNPFIFPSDSTLDFGTKKRMANAAMHKLVLLKLPSGKVNLRIVSVIPTKNLNKPWRGNVNKVGKDFTGWMIVRQWNEKERAVWYFENGKRIKQYKSVKLNPKGVKRKSQGSWPGQCQARPVTEIVQVCTQFCGLINWRPLCMIDPYADSNADVCRDEEQIVDYEYDCNGDGNYDDNYDYCDNNGQCYCNMLSGFCDDNDNGQGGGGGGGGSSNVYFNGELVTIDNYPGKDLNFPWLWWETYAFTPDEQAIIDEEQIQDVRIISEVETPCNGTLRFPGGFFFPGTIEHLMIQFDYQAKHSTAKREYKIPMTPLGGIGTQQLDGTLGYADIADPVTKQIFEIKPDNPNGRIAGANEASLYVAAASANCGLGAWSLGTGYPITNLPYPGDPTRTIIARMSDDNGVIVYRREDRATNPVTNPVFVPQSVSERLKQLMKQIMKHPYEIEEQIMIFLTLPENADIRQFAKFAGISVAVTMVIASIIEDFGTFGAGIWNDTQTFLLAAKIFRMAIAF